MAPTLINQLGPWIGGGGGVAHQFLTMRGEIAQPQDRIERMVRPGVDYAAYRMIGFGNQPFTLRTSVDVLDMAAGRTLMLAYSQKKGTAHKLIHKGTDFELPPYTLGCHVLDVRLENLSGVVKWSGAFNDDNLARLDVTWTLELKSITP